MAEKQLWFTFYISIALGIVIGAILRVGLIPVNVGSIWTAILNTATILHFTGADRLYFIIIAIIAITGSVIIAIHHTFRNVFDSGEYGIYVAIAGFLGGLILALAFLNALSVIGIILLLIGVGITYKYEREPPGSPIHRKKSEPFSPFS